MKIDHNQHDLISYGLLAAATFFWASAFVIGKDLLDAHSPFMIAALRFALASILWVPFLLWRSPHVFLDKTLWKLAVIPALFGVLIYNVAFFVGLDYSLASHAVLLVPGLGPAFTAILTAILLKNAVLKKQIIGIALSFCGIFMLVADGILINKDWFLVIIGNLILLTCVLCWSLYTLNIKSITEKFEIDILALTGLSTLIGTVGLIVIAAVFTTEPIAQLKAISLVGWGQLASIAFFSTNLAFLFWTIGIKRIGPVRSAIFLNLVPLWGVIMAMLYLNETLGLLGPIAIPCILGGVWLTQTKPKAASK